MSPGSTTESYPAVAQIGLRKTPGKKPRPDNLLRPGFEHGPDRGGPRVNSDEPREFNLPTSPQRRITYMQEKLPTKYGVHSEEYLPHTYGNACRGRNVNCLETRTEFFNMSRVFRKLPWGRKHGISIDGRKLTNLRFVDDVVLFARSRKRFEVMLNDLCEESMAVGLIMNTSKTEVLTNDVEGQIIVNNANIEFFTPYIYLGQTISFQNSMDKEIDRRIASAWKKFWSLFFILMDKSQKLQNKKVDLQQLDCTCTSVWGAILVTHQDTGIKIRKMSKKNGKEYTLNKPQGQIQKRRSTTTKRHRGHEISDTSVVSVRETKANKSNSAKISGKHAVTSTKEETGVTRTGMQQAQQNKTAMQANGNSGHQMGAILKRVKELRSKSRLTRSRVMQIGDSLGSSNEGRGENKVKKQYDLRKWYGGEMNREERKLRPIK
ncbi:hypothetical protein ANN_11765 [Periplaneta americana]|uniref:Reverse transcriptase domain-containing protein n=1 Tax=Periplaneta americana TaxID=6978 RepID=A0ABQ8T7R1_PERAM|nr:hypothetical protein ANN_11765 [Periplaneta americana]